MDKGTIKGFVQTKRTVEEVLGLPVLSAQEFSKAAEGSEVCIIIATQDRYQQEIANTLQENFPAPPDICRYEVPTMRMHLRYMSLEKRDLTLPKLESKEQGLPEPVLRSIQAQGEAR